MDELGTIIRDARKAKNMSLRALEQRVGVSNAHLSQLETGKIERPSMALLYSLAEALDLEYNRLTRLAGHKVTRRSEGQAAVGVAFQGADDLTPREAEEVAKFIELMKKRRWNG